MSTKTNWQVTCHEETSLLSNGEEGVYTGGSDKIGVSDDELITISEHWKKVVSFSFTSMVCFVFGATLLFSYSAFRNRVVMYTVFTIGVLYLLLHFAASYYMYRDAEAISQNSGVNSILNNENTYIWEPRPFVWSVFILASPPFIELLPLTVYISRRHDILGVP